MRRGKIIGMIALCLLLVAGCMPGMGTRVTEIKYVIGVSLANLSEQWRLVLKEELEAAALEYDSVRLVVSDAAGNSEKQIADVERLMEFGVDLLIISPTDVEELTPVISDVYEKIPVIVLDRVVEGYEYSLFIGPDNRLIGRQAGEMVLEILQENKIENGSVLEIKTDSFASKSRSEEFIKTLSEVGISTCSVFPEEATRDCVEDMLLERPDLLKDIDIIFAHNDYMAYGARLALDKLNISGIKIVGLDGFANENGGLQMVMDGTIDGTVTCPTGGKEAVRYAIDIINKQSGIPKQIILRSHKVDSGNVWSFQEKKNEEEWEERVIRVGYAQISEESGWRQASIESIQAAAREFDIDLTMLYSEQSQEEQIAQVRKFISENMDVIVISPVVAEGWQEVLEEARAAQIPVLLVDRMASVEEELYESFIGADFEEEGRRCAQWMMEETKTSSRVCIMELQGTKGASPTQYRKAGFERTIAEDNRYEIVYSQSADFSREGGRQVVREYLLSNDWDIDVIYAHNDEMALGAIEVLKEYGIQPGEDVIIMSIDATSDALTALKKGELNCVVECNPLLGAQIMKAITDLVQGEELPLRIITNENVFTEDTSEELFRNRKY